MEHEVMGHTKKLYKISTDKKKGVWHKAKEIIVEILIIVFAVSLSIWFHGRSEHSHQQKEVQQFLTGLKTDLQSDITEMQTDVTFFRQSRATFSYLLGAYKAGTIEKDSIAKYAVILNNLTELIPNNGRYEGFKSSGKLTNIENNELQNDILALYQEDLPALLASTNNYSRQKQKLFDYLMENRKQLKTGGDNTFDLLLSDVPQNMFQRLVFTAEIDERYNNCINRAQKIVASIENEIR